MDLSNLLLENLIKKIHGLKGPMDESADMPDEKGTGVEVLKLKSLGGDSKPQGVTDPDGDPTMDALEEALGQSDDDEYKLANGEDDDKQTIDLIKRLKG